MKKIVLVGGGGHCRSVLDSLLMTKQYDEIVITDAEMQPGSKILGCRVAGTDSSLPLLRENGFEYAFISVGSIQSCELRKRLASVLSELGFRIPVITDPIACVSGYASVGQGTFVGKNAVINAGAVVGEHCIINTGSIVEHECEIGSFSHISVGSILCGGCRVGYETFIGAGSTVIQGKVLGNRVVIGVNSTVLSDVNDDRKAYGIIAE